MKVLIVYNGINAQEYALKSLLEHPEFKGKYFAASRLSYPNLQIHTITWNRNSHDAYYDCIIEIQTEKFFDSAILNFFQRFWLIGVPLTWWDKLGDYFKAIFNYRIINGIRRCSKSVEFAIKNNCPDAEIDCVAHSLGTLLALDSGITFNKLMLMGSPLTSRLWTVRKTANNFVRKRIITPRGSKPYYFWSKKDIVCSKPAGSNWAENKECHCDHAIEGYIDEAVKKGVLKG